MTAAPPISVIVPCYNAAATVGETIESALTQDVACEVIVVDDGSTDSSAQVLKGFGDRITAYFGPNRGVSATRNQAAATARGEWLLFLDSDDLLTAGTVRARLDAASGGQDVVICDWREFTSDGGVEVEGRLRSVDPEALRRDPQVAFARHVWAPPAAVLYRRGVVEKVGGFREDLPVIQDARFLFDAAYHGVAFVHIPHVGARYRVVAGSLSRRKPGQFWRDVLLNGRQIEALWRARGPLDEAHLEVLAGIYNNAARGLLAAHDGAYLDAVAEQARLGQVPLHSRLAAPLTRLAGVAAAHRVLALLGRG